MPQGLGTTVTGCGLAVRSTPRGLGLASFSRQLLKLPRETASPPPPGRMPLPADPWALPLGKPQLPGEEQGGAEGPQILDPPLPQGPAP